MKMLITVTTLLCSFQLLLAEDLRLLDLEPTDAQQYIEKQDTTLKYAPKIDSNVPALRFIGNEQQNVLEDIYLANQYHGQDGLGGYLYGYSVPDIAKTEKKKAGGDLRGAYNYIAGDGQEIKVEYWDDGHGFHQVDNVPKILPKQIDDLPEVKAAKDEHLRLWHEQAERNSRPVQSPYNSEGQYASGPLSKQGQLERQQQFAQQAHYQQPKQYQQQNQYQQPNQYQQQASGQYQQKTAYQQPGQPAQVQQIHQQQFSQAKQFGQQPVGQASQLGQQAYAQKPQQAYVQQPQGQATQLGQQAYAQKPLGQAPQQGHQPQGQASQLGQQTYAQQPQAQATQFGQATRQLGPQPLQGQYPQPHAAQTKQLVQQPGQYQAAIQHHQSQNQHQSTSYKKENQVDGEDDGEYRPQDGEGEYQPEADEEQGPPRGFFYNFDYPVGIIVQKQGGAQHTAQKREGELKDVYAANKAIFEEQLQGKASAPIGSSTGYLYVKN